MLNLSCVKRAAAIIILTGGFAAGAQAQTTSADAAGKTLFLQNCASCHGESGAGGIHFGSAVSADLRAPELEKTYGGKDALILRAILTAKDQNGEPLDPPMPAWAGRLSTAQATDILAYLHKLHS